MARARTAIYWHNRKPPARPVREHCLHLGGPTLEFRQIRYALSVAKERSFTKAAKRLNISQSAVSEQIKLLEQDIGFPLFRRTSGGIELTERGRTFIIEAERDMGAYLS